MTSNTSTTTLSHETSAALAAWLRGHAVRGAAPDAERARAAMRELLGGVSRLPRGAGEEVDALAARVAARVAIAHGVAEAEAEAAAIAAGLRAPRGAAEGERAWALLAGRAGRAVRRAVRRAYDSCGYRRSESRWAGGEHSVAIAIARRAAATGESRRAWSRNGSWSGTSSEHRIVVRPGWRQDVESQGAAVVGGLLTLDLGAEVEPGICPARWVEQARGVGLRAAEGYLVRLGGTAWQHADTLVGARRALYAARRGSAAGAPDLGALDAPALLARCRCAPEAPLRLATAPIEGRVCAAGVRDWAARRGLPVDDRLVVPAAQVARLAVESRDRLALVALVLRAAGARWRRLLALAGPLAQGHAEAPEVRAAGGPRPADADAWEGVDLRAACAEAGLPGAEDDLREALRVCLARLAAPRRAPRQAPRRVRRDEDEAAHYRCVG